MPFFDQTYYDVTGNGEPVVFLHGGFCSALVMADLAAELSEHRVYSPERPGHGRTPDRAGALHYDDGVADTLAFLDAAGLASAHFVGHSDGADIALMLALAAPGSVRSIVAVSGNLRPGDDVYSDDPTSMPDAESDRVSEEYRALSPDGPGHHDDILDRIRTMWTTEPAIEPAALAQLDIPVLVMAGDNDVIALDHTTLIHRSIPGSRLAIVPGTSHMLVREKPQLVGAIIRDFLSSM